eukprot:CAMPEP_0174887276 /NCGR_PEP_ID=MMETSP0167-20121228/2531_1 /TAXON_ID=38298 /ORGANISM="Rhodella maculata, Strain CCMP736" /LENGTH=155 /DNA_ID=CAMNT_0016123691 /DNA_START=41 /DNA_END=508 /DNA_ORIENTATION=+
MKSATAVLLLVTLAAFVAGGPTCDPSWKRDLRKALKTYADPACYSYVYKIDAFSLVSAEGPYIVTVTNRAVSGVVRQATNSAVEMDGFMTVPELAGMVETVCLSGCPKSAPFKCEPTFDKQGVLTTLVYDGDERIADDEYTINVEDFSPFVCPSN